MQAPFVDSVFHPSDFSAGSEHAFIHALALALIRRTEFTILHTGGSREDWRNYPAGHEGFLDALRGSVTQQVLRRAPCPLLAVPE